MLLPEPPILQHCSWKQMFWDMTLCCRVVSDCGRFGGMSAAIHSVIQHHIPHVLSPRRRCCENVEFLTACRMGGPLFPIRLSNESGLGAMWHGVVWWICNDDWKEPAFSHSAIRLPKSQSWGSQIWHGLRAWNTQMNCVNRRLFSTYFSSVIHEWRDSVRILVQTVILLKFRYKCLKNAKESKLDVFVSFQTQIGVRSSCYQPSQMVR
jgi:hypothetical protein